MTGSQNKLHQWLTLGLPFPIVVFNGWLTLQVFQYFQPLVTIFGLAAVLAFILNYPVQFLQKRQFKRTYAVLLVLLLSFVILVALGITLIPILLEQLSQSAQLLPNWIDSGSQEIKALDDWVATRNLPINFSHLLSQLTERLPDELQSLAEELLPIALGTIDSVSEVVLTVVVACYLLIDGERIWNGLFQRLPSRFGIPLKQSLQQNFQNYIIGQVALAALVGFSMSLAFLALRVPFGLIFGLGIGIMTLIPFGDVLSFGLVGLLVASHNFWLGAKTLAVALVVDQTIDQAIAPRLLGKFTGLSPIWVIAALALGTKVAGLLGLLTAVPLASSLKSFLDSLQETTEDSSTSHVNLNTTQPDTCEKDELKLRSSYSEGVGSRE